MTSGKRDGDGPGPADEEGRKLLFGLRREDEGAEAEPRSPPRRPTDASTPASPAAPPVAKDRPGSRSAGADGSFARLAAAIDSFDAGQRRLEARLAEVSAGLAEVREAGPKLAQLERVIEEASEWANNVKAANEAHVEAAGSLIKGLQGGRGDLEEVVAKLKIREEGFKKQQETLDKGIQELRDLWKPVNERTLKIETAKKEFAHYYKAWGSGAATMQENMIALSKLLRSSVARMQESVNKNVEAQLEISTRTLGNVREFNKANDGFLERLDEGGEELLGAIRREWTDTRRWTVPALAVVLVLAAPSFAAVGAWAQSELGFFSSFEQKRAVERTLWNRYGHHLSRCSLRAVEKQRTVRCSFDVAGG